MNNKNETFTIASLSREDITTLGYRGAEDIPDSVMETIARKMGDSYIENQFWIDLECMVDTYCQLEKE